MNRSHFVHRLAATVASRYLIERNLNDEMLQVLGEACRRIGRFPTMSELGTELLRMYLWFSNVEHESVRCASETWNRLIRAKMKRFAQTPGFQNVSKELQAQISALMATPIDQYPHWQESELHPQMKIGKLLKESSEPEAKSLYLSWLSIVTLSSRDEHRMVALIEIKRKRQLMQHPWHFEPEISEAVRRCCEGTPRVSGEIYYPSLGGCCMDQKEAILTLWRRFHFDENPLWIGTEATLSIDRLLVIMEECSTAEMMTNPDRVAISQGERFKLQSLEPELVVLEHGFLGYLMSSNSLSQEAVFRLLVDQLGMDLAVPPAKVLYGLVDIATIFHSHRRWIALYPIAGEAASTLAICFDQGEDKTYSLVWNASFSFGLLYRCDVQTTEQHLQARGTVFSCGKGEELPAPSVLVTVEANGLFQNMKEAIDAHVTARADFTAALAALQATES